MPERQKPIGIFGGTFNPVHNGHLRLAEEAADIFDLAYVRWVPAGQPLLRTKPEVCAKQRLKMVQLAIKGNLRFKLDTTEAKAPHPSYTVTTLERLRKANCYGPQQPLVLLIGADVFDRLNKWHRWAEIFNLAHIALALRPGFSVNLNTLQKDLLQHYEKRLCNDPAELGMTPCGKIIPFSMTALDISATQIRSLLADKKSIRHLLPDSLISYIHHYHLYQGNQPPNENSSA